MIDARAPSPSCFAPHFAKPAVAAAILALLLAACATTRREEGVLVLADGDELAGPIAVERLWIPDGAIVRVGRDLDLVARGIVRIDGVLLVRDAAHEGLLDAPDVRIASALVIDVRGAIQGGRGRDGDSRVRQGGGGSTLELEAPLVRIAGEVRGGDAGDGGPAGAGGTGGSVIVDGTMQRRTDPIFRAQIVGGRAGDGGDSGGDMGSTGGTRWTVSYSLHQRLLEHAAEIEAELAAPPGERSGHGSR